MASSLVGLTVHRTCSLEIVLHLFSVEKKRPEMTSLLILVRSHFYGSSSGEMKRPSIWEEYKQQQYKRNRHTALAHYTENQWADDLTRPFSLLCYQCCVFFLQFLDYCAIETHDEKIVCVCVWTKIARARWIQVGDLLLQNLPVGLLKL